MIYRSNLTCPDLQPYFEPLICKPRPWSMGHDALSDLDFDPDCCFFTHDEAAILYHVAKKTGGAWVDIGSRSGWTSKHILEVGATLRCVDVAYVSNPGLYTKLQANLGRGTWSAWHGTVFDFFDDFYESFDGACIDGNHDSPCPVVDATLCATHGADVIVMHDFWGLPIREAVMWLYPNGFKMRVYNTPNGLAVCWRGEFTPPDHVPDPAINWAEVRRTRAPEFDFSKCV